MGLVKKQFFPTSDRPEVLVEVQMPYGTSIEQTSAATAKIEAWLQKQPEAKIVTAYIGQGRVFIWRWRPNYPTRRLPK
jgi:multidrug efflux pump subunit AcrB